MPANKHRLYVALYVRGGGPTMPGGEDRFHWAILVVPKDENMQATGMRLHAKERRVDGSAVWEFSNQETGTVASGMILIRVRVAKVEDVERLAATLKGIPMRPEVQGWNCVMWVKEALDTLNRDGKILGTARVDWETVRNTVMTYVQEKEAAHRFDGKAPPGTFNLSRTATFCMLEKKEIIP